MVMARPIMNHGLGIMTRDVDVFDPLVLLGGWIGTPQLYSLPGYLFERVEVQILMIKNLLDMAYCGSQNERDEQRGNTFPEMSAWLIIDLDADR
jgi:hypothetical protein